MQTWSDAFVTRQTMIERERVTIGLIAQRALLLSLMKYLLAEIRHLTLSVAFIERDDLGEALHRSVVAERGQVLIQVSLELVQEHGHLRVTKFRIRGKLHRVDEHGASGPHRR